MRLGNCIVLSVVFHLLFFGILGATYSNGHEGEQVFNVDIVDIKSLQAPNIKRSKPVLKKRQTARRRRRPMAKSLPPNRLFDEGPISPSINGGKDDVISPSIDNSDPLPDSGFEMDRPFLYDREVIEKYAAKIPHHDKGLTFDTSEFKHRGYMRMLQEKIEGIWEYPKEAFRKKMSGDLYITFKIKRKGELGEVEVVRTSGHRSLDRAAIKALKDAAPFWPLPDDWPEEELEIKGHFIYLYGSTYIM